MSISSPAFIFLTFLTLLTFYLTGKKLKSSRLPYWLVCIPCILVFTFVLGFRYGRGPDYLFYLYQYTQGGLMFDYKGPLFYKFNDFLKSLGVIPYFSFVVYSFVYITAALVLLKQYRKYSIYLFPLFIVAFSHLSEAMIRQAVSFSFVFLLLAILVSNIKLTLKVLLIIPCTYFSYMMHPGNILYILGFILCWFFVNKPLPYQITIPLYVISSYILCDLFDFNLLTKPLELIGVQNELFSGYVERSSGWFSKEAMNEQYERNAIIKIWQTWGDCALMYCGYYVLSRIKSIELNILYNMFIAGAIFMQLFFTLEILRRVGVVAYWFWCFPLAVVLCYSKLFLNSKDWKLKFAFFGLLFFAYDYLKYLLFSGENCLFLWDVF